MTKILNFFKRNSKYLALSILSGILVGTSYIPFNGWALLFGYVPLWLAVTEVLDQENGILKSFIFAWITQFVLTLIGFNWIYYVSVEFGALHPVVASAALFLFAAFMHLYIPVAVTLAAFTVRRLRLTGALPRFLLIAISMGLIERVWPSIFEWNMAYTLLWIKWPIFQWADVVGFWGLSTWVLVFQAFVAAAWLLRVADRKTAVLLAVSSFAVFAGLNLTGSWRGKRWDATDNSVRIGVVQGNIGNAEKLQSEKHDQFHAYIISIYSQLTTELLKKEPADLVIWPETAMPLPLDKNYLGARDQQSILKLSKALNTTIITGGYSVNSQEKNHLGETVIRNSVFYLSPQMNYAAPPYFKTNLLAFGEYLPFGETFPALYKLLPFVGVYAQGSGPLVADITTSPRHIRLGPQICYDSLYPDYSRNLSKNGAQVLFNVTNDAWFGWWAEPFQHQFMTLARAVEVRRPLVRSTNTGVSSAILANGEVLSNSPIGKAWGHTYEIKYRENPELTLYTRFGHYDWVFWLLLTVLIALTSRKKESHV